jgi:glucosamine--fructose-6-phosphate aminotransferase (isomerizing)
LDTAKTQELVDGLAQLPRLMGDLLADSAAYQHLAKEYVGTDYFLFLGRGMNSPIASEGSLKLKEISYVHAEAYPAGEMKHGPIALIDNAMATVALAPKDSLYDKVVNNVKEVMARDGRVLAVLTEGDTQLAAEADHALYLPEVPEHLIPLLAVVPLQMLAYHVALLLNRDVDQPRNLAKSVTVE